MPDVMIRLEGVSKSFGTQQVLRDVSFDVVQGETFAIIGASGCGKSVTLKIMTGLMRADSGRIELFGQDMTSATEAEYDEMRRRMSMVFQSGALFDSLTVGDNVAFALDQHTETEAGERAEIIATNLDRVGLPGIQDKMPSELSGGMRKRVALARALALKPSVILFDEPTTGLDPITTTEIGQLIAMLRRDLGMTSVMVSHDIKNVMEIASRIGVHYKGKLVAIGTPEEIQASRQPYVQQFLHGLTEPPEGDRT